MALAGPLLVFTGFWHALEWLMGGRNRDTLRLIPMGILYAILGWLIVTFTGGTPVLIVALALTALGMTAALFGRHKLQIRPWVIWSFILIDAVIIVGLVLALTGS